MTGLLCPRCVGLVVSVAGLSAGSVSAQIISTFTPDDPGPPFIPSANWTDADAWDTASFPDNGQPNAGDTYDAIIGTGVANLNADITIEALTLTNDAGIGDSTERNTLTLNGVFNFEEGDISGESTIDATAGVNFATAGTKSLNVSFPLGGGASFQPIINASGSSTWTDGNVGGQVVSSVYGLLNLLPGATFDVTAAGRTFSARIDNQAGATINANPGAGQAVTMRRLVNAGDVVVHTGTLELEEFISQLATPHTGSFDVRAGTGLLIKEQDFGPTSTVTGAGDVFIEDFSDFDGTIDIDGLLTITGLNDITGTLSAGAFNLEVSTFGTDFRGGGTINTDGPTRWLEGSVEGDVTINANGGVTFESTDRMGVRENTVLNLGGTSTWQAGSDPVFTIEDAAEFNVKPGATLVVEGAKSISSPFDPRGTLNLDGTLRKTGGGSLSIGVNVNNTGLVVIDADNTILFTNSSSAPGLTMTAGEIRLDGGAVGGVRNFLGGSLTGTGFFNGGLELPSGAVIAPGHDAQAGPSIGVLDILRLDLLPGSVAEIELAGTDPAEFDRIINDEDDFFADPGDLTLGGDLDLRFAAAFQNVVTMADTFAIFEATKAIDGTFDNVAPGQRLFTADGFGSFVVNYGPSSPFGDNMVVLSDYEVIPEPAVSLLLFTLPVVARRRRR